MKVFLFRIASLTGTIFVQGGANIKKIGITGSEMDMEDKEEYGQTGEDMRPSGGPHCELHILKSIDISCRKIRDRLEWFSSKLAGCNYRETDGKAG